VLLLGRSPGSASKLAEIFRTKEAKKTYWAIVVGQPHPAKGKIDLAIGKGASASSPDERMLVDGPGAKRAVTYYSVVEEASKRAAWVALRPITGRTHQLRVHCAAMGNPILGDGKYGGSDAFIFKGTNGRWRNVLTAGDLALLWRLFSLDRPRECLWPFPFSRLPFSGEV